MSNLFLHRTKVYLEIDNRACYKYKQGLCFDNTASAAQFFAAALQSGAKVNLPINSVSSIMGDTGGTATPMTLVYIVVGCGAVLLLTLAVIIVISRHTERAVTWFPEGFFTRGDQSKPTRSRKGPDGEEMK